MLLRRLLTTLKQKTRLNLASTRAFSSNGGDQILPATEYISWDTKVPVKLRMSDTAPGNWSPILVQTMLREATQKFGPKTAIVSCDGKTRWTYNEYFQNAEKAAKSFISLGLQPMNGVGIMGNNCPEWFLCSIGAIFAGGLSCGIYTTNSPQTVSYIAQHAPLDVLVFEDPDMLNYMLNHQPDLEKMVKSFILFNGQDPKALSWTDFMSKSENVSDTELKQREETQAANQACLLVYTSGTTGPPKGAILSHDNVTQNAMVSNWHYGWNVGMGWKDEVYMSYLPLSHVAGLLIDLYMSFCAGSQIHFADKNALKGTLVDNLQRVRPTKFVGVPRVWEKIAEGLQKAGKDTKGLKKSIAKWAKNQATQHHLEVRQGKRQKHQWSLGYKLAKKIVLTPIHRKLGLDRCVDTHVPMSSSAAPLNLDTFEYLQSLDMVVTEIYGSTETSGPVAANMEGPALLPGSVGQKYSGMHNKIIDADEDGYGEIVSNGRFVFMGYQKDEAKTKETFTSDGYFKSGDIGKIDDNGFLWMSGRLKELLITSGGENIAPLLIENNISAELNEVLSYVVVVGDGRKYLTSLLTLKCKPETNILDDEAMKWVLSRNPHFHGKTVEDFQNDETLCQEIMLGIQNANVKATANPHKVQKFRILDQDLSIQGGELGPTLKLKRHAIKEKYANIIDSMYIDDY